MDSTVFRRVESNRSLRFSRRDTLVLRDTESFGHADLRELAGVPELAQGHFLRYQLSSAGLDLLSLGRA